VTSPFEILDVDREADAAEVEAAYRRRVKEVHPDQGGSAEAFQRVTAAYEELSSRGRTERDVGTSPGPESWAASGPATAAQSEETNEGATNEGTIPRDTTVEYLNYEVLDDHGWAVNDDDLFEKAAEADLDAADYGTLSNGPEDSLLEAAEASGYTWPYSCRGGACANCAVAVVDGDVDTPVDHILTDDLVDRGFRLSCLGEPTTAELQVIYNVKHMPDLEELLLPPGPFARANPND
jgi:ferredoxin